MNWGAQPMTPAAGEPVRKTLQLLRESGPSDNRGGGGPHFSDHVQNCEPIGRFCCELGQSRVSDNVSPFFPLYRRFVQKGMS